MTSVLEVHDLEFGFQPNRPALRGISFTVGGGESVGVLGANGAGKSTLLWCLLGLYRPRGQVLLFGSKPSRQVRARVGVVFQNPEDLLFMPRLLDDLALPLLNRGMAPNDAREEARNALREAGLEDYAEGPAAHMSLGQRKRAAIAAALITAPELILLDEPTAELDARAKRRLAESLSVADTARVITSHDVEFLRRTCQRLLILHRGTLVADGPSSLLLDDTGLLEGAELL